MHQPPRLLPPLPAPHRGPLRHAGAVLSPETLATLAVGAARAKALALTLTTALALAAAAPAHAQGQAPAPQSQGNATSAAKAIGDQVRAAVRAGIDPKPQTLTVEIPAPPGSRTVAPVRSAQAAPAPPSVPRPRAPSMEPLPPVFTPPGGIPNPAAQREALRARAAAMAATTAVTATTATADPMPPAVRGQVTIQAAPPMAPRSASASGAAAGAQWSYEGATGPQAWGQMHPDWAQCSRGRRQSPIAIDDASTLRGPAEPISITYRPSTASVLHTGRTLQVDLQGDNSISVRNASFRLQQIQFHHPAEERINGQGFAMSAHLLHRSADGQMAVLVLLLEPGDASPVIDKVWTYLPLEVGDRVQMPPDSLDLTALLPKDPRYYQYLGSLTTPPCTEGVLRLVMKQPVTLSREQLRLFGQLFPNNARPAQPLNGRMVRSAQ
jgi:carbonic anhydrase